MRKKIFWSIFLASVASIILTALLIVGVIYSNSITALKKEVRAQAVFVSEALDESRDLSEDYLKAISRKTENRITLIAQDGTVLFDNYADVSKMENHSHRPEIVAAAQKGFGDSTRHSDTIGKQNYYYAVRLESGQFLRVANTTQSAFGMVGNAAGLALLLVAFACIAGLIVANLLTGLFLRPLNHLNLDEPLKNETYEELSPLLTSLDKKNKQISLQMAELSAKQKEFEYITSSMNEGLVVFDSQGRILSANRSATEAFDSRDPQTVPALCRDLEYIALMNQALSGIQGTRNITYSGRIYQLTASPVRDASDHFAVVLFIVDVTERETAEKQRREFSANVSHELKTPLTSIMGYAELIQSGFAKTEDVPDFAGRIYEESSRLLSLIQDIMKLSRLDEQSAVPEFEPVDLFEIAQSVRHSLTPKAQGAEVKFQLNGGSQIVNGCQPVLHEMIFNLCDNAIAYNKPGGTVSVNVAELDGKPAVTVSDSGIGIPQADRERVFERFYRVDKSHSKNTGGTGLGLSIVKHGAILHHAEIKLESTPGVGTTITLRFPD